MKKPTTLDTLVEMAKEYDVENNALFASTLDTYMIQKKAIDKIKESMDGDDITTTKEYVKGRENVYLHPAIKELPRHADAINKTTSQLLDIIKVFGNKKKNDDELMEFIK
jgi:hypothetical protein